MSLSPKAVFSIFLCLGACLTLSPAQVLASVVNEPACLVDIRILDNPLRVEVERISRGFFLTCPVSRGDTYSLEAQAGSTYKHAETIADVGVVSGGSLGEDGKVRPWLHWPLPAGAAFSTSVTPMQ